MRSLTSHSTHHALTFHCFVATWIRVSARGRSLYVDVGRQRVPPRRQRYSSRASCWAALRKPPSRIDGTFPAHTVHHAPHRLSGFANTNAEYAPALMPRRRAFSSSRAVASSIERPSSSAIMPTACSTSPRTVTNFFTDTATCE